VSQPPAHALALGLLIGGAGLLTAILGLGAWAASFSSLYVVNPSHAPLLVRIDGKEIGQVAASLAGSTHDVPYERFEVRAGEPHHLEIASGPNPTFRHAYDLDPAKGAQGWVVAPGSMAAGLCLVETEAVYGAGEPADPELLNEKGDLAPLPRTYDYLFDPAPSSMSTSESSVRRWALRALTCDSIEDGKPIAFQAKRAAASSAPHH
jgi:hypothetical protein